MSNPYHFTNPQLDHSADADEHLEPAQLQDSGAVADAVWPQEGGAKIDHGYLFRWYVSSLKPGQIHGTVVTPEGRTIASGWYPEDLEVAIELANTNNVAPHWQNTRVTVAATSQQLRILAGLLSLSEGLIITVPAHVVAKAQYDLAVEERLLAEAEKTLWALLEAHGAARSAGKSTRSLAGEIKTARSSVAHWTAGATRARETLNWLNAGERSTGK